MIVMIVGNELAMVMTLKIVTEVTAAANYNDGDKKAVVCRNG